MRLITNWRQMEEHVSQWRSNSPLPLGYVLSMEGADPILDAEDAIRWWELGLRVVGLAHYGPGIYAHGTSSSGGLTPKGIGLLRTLENLGMIVDVTHLTDEGFWDVVERYKGPLLASHNNCRALVPGQRQFSDDQIRCLVRRRAVIGVALDSWMLWPGYVPGTTENSKVTLNHVVDHIDHICQLAGCAKHAAIGSDLDGGFGREQSPSDLETISDVKRIAYLLRDRGYREADIQNIMHGNWLRFFREMW